MRAVVCTYSRHDLAAMAVAHLRRNASGVSRFTVLDASGTMQECDGADEVLTAKFRRNAGAYAAMAMFRDEDLLCIDDDVLLLEPIDVSRYTAHWSKPPNGQMVFVCRRGVAGVEALPQIRIRNKETLAKYPWAAEAAKHQSELIDGVWLHIDRGSSGPIRTREELIDAMGGPGTELKTLLARIGITAKPGCACTQRAKVMNERGCDWCEQNLEKIDSWLAEEAGKRKLPYLSLAGKALIRMAIRRARKKGTDR